ncbi:MAG: GTPase, partial [Candidatus Hodarchaeota archaeon]
MPTNLTAEAQAAWERYLEAKTTAERIRCLEEYISEVPKHKGAEKLLRDAKTRLSKLKAQQVEERARRKGTGEKWLVPKEEEAQLSLIGLPNSGKTSFLNQLTGSSYDVGDFPFTTVKPTPGVINCKGARLQIVDLPPLVNGSSEGVSQGTKVLSAIRNGDGAIIVVDLSQNPAEQLDTIFDELNSAKIRINLEEPNVIVEKTASGGIQVSWGENFEHGVEGAKEVLHKRGFTNAIVRFRDKVTLDELLDALDASVCRVPGIIIATKGDLPGSRQNYEALKNSSEVRRKFEIFPVSAKTNDGFEGLEEKIFAMLRLKRVYTRDSSGQVSPLPICLQLNGTVKDAVEILSKKFLAHFRFCRVWGSSVKFDGQSVGLDHALADQDRIQVFA